jgi:ankyrin repeat protein
LNPTTVGGTISNISTAVTSPVDPQFDFGSPSTLHLSAISSRRSRRSDVTNVTNELKRILPTVHSKTHRKALVAIDRYGYDTVKWTKGFSALHWAYKTNRIDIAEYLVSRGADVNAKDDCGKLPHEYCTESEKMSLDGIDELHTMVNMTTLPESHRTCLETIASKGWANLKWAGGWTIFHWAYQEHRDDVIEYLRHIGIPEDLRDDSGHVPSYYGRRGTNLN